MVFVNTLWSGLGGEGHVEIEWLETTLREHSDARHKLVPGHHPVFPVNGFGGAYQREIGYEYTRPFWDVLVKRACLSVQPHSCLRRAGTPWGPTDLHRGCGDGPQDAGRY